MISVPFKFQTYPNFKWSTMSEIQKIQIRNEDKMLHFQHFPFLLPTKEIINLSAQNIKPIQLALCSERGFSSKRSPGKYSWENPFQWINFSSGITKAYLLKQLPYTSLNQTLLGATLKQRQKDLANSTFNWSLINALLKNIIVIRKFTEGRQLSFLLSLLTFITSKKYFLENKAKYIPFGTEKKFITSIKMTCKDVVSPMTFNNRHRFSSI